MKRKSNKIKRKTKSQIQFKDFVLAVLVVALLVIVVTVTKDYFKIGASEAAPPSPVHSALINPSRDWPSFAIKPTKIVKPSGIVPKDNPGPDVPPGPSNIVTPYAFIKAVGMNSYGPVYYSPGTVVPTVIFSGNCVTPVPAGNYVFCIRVDTTFTGGFPSRTTPIKIDVNSGVITDLAASRDYPSLWNYLVPADNGNDYLYGAIAISGPEAMTGPLYIFNNGVQAYYAFGSYMQPTLSGDGALASWNYDSTPATSGNRDYYVFTVATQIAVKVHDVGNNSECESGDFAQIHGAMSTAWLVKINTPGDGWRDSNVFRAHKSGVWGVGVQVNDSAHRWNEPPRWSDVPKHLIWASNRDAYLYAGYSIWGAPYGQPNLKMEITTWDPNRQDLWPDVDDEGIIIYGRGVGYWSHYIPSVTYFDSSAEYSYIIDPGGICRDYRFANQI
jgi:hypothetical protein